MNDTALKNFATWARTKLLMDVRTRAATYRIDADGAQADAVARVDGEVLSPQEQRQRADLLRVVRAEGFDALMERAAYTWFNRILAIRFMEVNDRLPSGVRLFSTGEGAFSRRTQAIEESLSLDIEGLDRQQVLDAIQASSDERLFRLLFLAQCAELSACMPAVFEPIGSAMELLLPDNLLATDGVIQHLVEDIPEQDWREGVEIVGWMYQYYNAERKDEFFSSKRKASASDLAPATQLFTPEWIVRYLAQNSLGRLWMLNHPDSKLAEQMKYYLSPEEGNCEDARKIESPEEIAVCDPACGSGHILVYAFDLLAAMYDEAGYSRRDIPRLILERNLTGFEIDPRAAQMASFALTMKACEVDARFLRRAVAPHIVVLNRIELDEEDLARAPHVAARKQLVDAMAHLDECGSLLVPSEDGMRAIEDDLAVLSGEDGDLFAGATLAKLKAMQQLCSELSNTFDAVIANPPYMGSSNMGPWLAKWMAKHYSDAKRDLCTCFLERGFTLANEAGYSAMVTMQSWMFLGSFEKMRESVLAERSIVSMAHLGTRAFSAIGGEVVSTTATVFHCEKAGETGEYLRLVDFDSEESKEQAIREAIANPDCGWFYRRSAQDFKSIPGTPIAYWASEAMRRAFKFGRSFKEAAFLRVGMQTGDNDSFLRLWWEPSRNSESFDSRSQEEFSSSGKTWAAYNKGGQFRKWYGNMDYVINWYNEGALIRTLRPGETRSFSILPREKRFSPAITWTDITSAGTHFRYRPAGSLYDIKGMSGFPEQEEMLWLLGFSNSSVAASMLSILSPTMNNQVGDVGKMPCRLDDKSLHALVDELVMLNIAASHKDWDLLETSWDFERHPLV